MVVEEYRVPGGGSPAVPRNPAQGRRLTVRAGYFHDSDTGLLSDNDPEQEITVEYSDFTRNGHEDGKAHNLYIGSIARFEMRFSSSSGARAGHLLKSRAKHNLIAYNRLADIPSGPASYELDFPRSTDATVIGNLILQAEASPNGAVLSYGAEDKGRAPEGRLRIVSNTFVSLRSRPIFVFNHTPYSPRVGNVFGGAAGEPAGPAEVRQPGRAAGRLADPAVDFHLREPCLRREDAVPASVTVPDLVLFSSMRIPSRRASVRQPEYARVCILWRVRVDGAQPEPHCRGRFRYWSRTCMRWGC